MPEDFQARLRRLRREDDASPANGALAKEAPEKGAAKKARTGPPVWLKHKLRAKAQRRVEAATPATSVPTTSGEPADLVETEGVVARETLRARSDLHGGFALEEVTSVDASVFALLTGDPALADLDPLRAVYLDTETTGLSGGAGTYVYMVGLGTFDGERFRVWQGFMRGPEQEAALLAECAARIAAADTVVSFFGKSFDRHRLEDKMRAHGVTPPFGRPHLDLYHPLARLTKGRLPDGRLGTLEQALCEVERDDDLPGSLAPAAWFDYLAGRPHRLEGVFRHNLDDVLSLVTLAAHLGRAREEQRADGAPLAGCPATRARALGRALLAGGDRSAALEWIERAVERGRQEGLEVRDLELDRAELLRRMARLDEAAEAYAALVAEADDLHSLRGLIGWAKLLEHDRRDPRAALTCCERALALIDLVCDGTARSGQARRLREELERRRVRLERR